MVETKKEMKGTHAAKQGVAGAIGKERIRLELAANGREKIWRELEEEKKMQLQKGMEDTEPESMEAKDMAEVQANQEAPHSGKPDGEGKTEAGADGADKPGQPDACADLQKKEEEELQELKAWLFQENIRMEKLRRETEELQMRLEQDRKQFEEYVQMKKNSMEMDRKRLEQENRFFDQKMKILQGGFEQLEEDRRKFRKEKDKFYACREVYSEKQDASRHNEVVGMLFCGVNSFLALKKRYKDLIKMFHPDNVAGDQEMVQLINREYEELKKAYEVGMQA